ncbi:hypothetical protein SPHINGOR109_10792 [Sphingorhabdus sp. 109]|nr:hypothetical protein SPHINGOR109_10792 [Sphingorhabdus sp. 109]
MEGADYPTRPNSDQPLAGVNLP